VNEALAKKAKERVGQVFARKWHVDRLLDMGGMASVYAATHRNGNRVAIKLLHPTYAEHEDVKRRFLEEGYVANKVGHPGAVQVLDDDVVDDGTPFLVMELLDGESLEERLRKKTVLAPTGVLYIADRVLDVLAAAHDKEIVHRDIKPANIPPEQARGKRDLIDARTDIWAVGATMWKAMTGRHVHEAETVQERLIAAMSQKARSIKELMPELPAPIVDVVDRALAFQKVERWPTAREMKTALAEAYEAIEKRPFPTVQRVSVADMFPNAPVSAPPMSTTSYDVAVSVVFEPDVAAQSIVVDFEDSSGKQDRYELRRKQEVLAPSGPDDPTDELSDISIVELDPK
jgi:serine/threonine-protein kinase